MKRTRVCAVRHANGSDGNQYMPAGKIDRKSASDVMSHADKKKNYKLHVNINKVWVENFTQGSNYTQDELARTLLKKRTSVRIAAIRRIGDRGTSILNWLGNQSRSYDGDL